MPISLRFSFQNIKGCLCVFLALGSWRQGDQEIKVSLGCVIPSHKTVTTKPARACQMVLVKMLVQAWRAEFEPVNHIKVGGEN